MRFIDLNSLLATCTPRRCLALGLLAVATGCSKPQAATSGSPSAAASAGQPAAVTTVKPEQKSFQRVIERPAHIQAFEETPLLARIAGYVHKVHVDLGDRVRGPRFDDKGNQVEPGQVLAELYVPEMEEELRQKQALVSQAQAEVEQAAAAVAAAEANIETARAFVLEAKSGRDRAQANYERWESEYQRIQRLAGSVLDQQTLDETRNQFKATAAALKEVEAKVHSAEAAARESEARRDKAKADLAAARAKVLVAQAEEARHRAMLAYSKVRAPYDGVITSRTIHTGHYLTGTGTKPLFVVARTDTLRVLADVPEADALFINQGVRAQIRCQMVKDQEFEGKVTRSSWSLDTKSRTLRTEIDLDNPAGKLRPGMYAYVSFHAELPRTFTLPASAILTQGDEAACFCLKDGKAVRTPIKIGVRQGPLVQVLKKQTRPPGKDGEAAVWEDFTGQETVLGNPGSWTDGQAVAVERGA